VYATLSTESPLYCAKLSESLQETRLHRRRRKEEEEEDEEAENKEEDEEEEEKYKNTN
jgi:hypothetical protein